MLKPGFANAPFAFVIAQLRWRGAGTVLVEENQMVKEAAGVNLAKGFFRSVVGKLLKRSSMGFFGLSSCCSRAEIFRLEVSSRYSRSSLLCQVVLRAKIIAAFIGCHRGIQERGRSWFPDGEESVGRSCL